jgi:hypothetical protein
LYSDTSPFSIPWPNNGISAGFLSVSDTDLHRTSRPAIVYMLSLTPSVSTRLSYLVVIKANVPHELDFKRAVSNVIKPFEAMS